MRPPKKWLCSVLSMVLLGSCLQTPAMAADYNFKTEDSREFYTQTSASQITGDIFVTSEGTTIQAGAAVVGPISYPSITAPTNPSINYPNYTQPGVPSVESMALPGTTTTNSNGTVTISNSSSQSSSSVYEDDLFPDIWFNDTTVSYNHFTLPDKVLNSDGSIGRLIINEIGLNVKVYEEESMESMSRGVGHFKATSCWDGNIGLAGHNRGKNNYFGKLKNLEYGDIVQYQTKLGTRRYKVFYSGRIDATDFSRLERSSENMITMITCVENRPELRYCVQAKEI